MFLDGVFEVFLRLIRFSRKIKGTKFAFLGPRASGKTTLISLLMKGEIPQEYIATARPQKMSGKTVKLQDLKLKIAPFFDLPGDLGSHGDWEREYMEADVICYLCDASRLCGGDQEYEEVVTREMRHIGEWFESRKVKPQRFFIVATHCDLIPRFAELPFARRTEFTDAFWKMPVMQNLVHHGKGVKNVRCVAGSLLVKEESDSLVGNILRQVNA